MNVEIVEQTMLKMEKKYGKEFKKEMREIAYHFYSDTKHLDSQYNSTLLWLEHLVDFAQEVKEEDAKLAEQLTALASLTAINVREQMGKFLNDTVPEEIKMQGWPTYTVGDYKKLYFD